MNYAASHSVVCNARPADVYRLICDSSRWPEMFEPCRSVTVLQREADFERIAITALVNGRSMTLQAERRFLPELYGIDSAWPQPMALVAAMQTRWRVLALNREQCVLLLEHDYELSDEIAGQVEGVETLAEAERYIADIIDRDAACGLGEIKRAVERAAGRPLVWKHDRTACHTLVCEASADSVYALIRDTANWPILFEDCLCAEPVARAGNIERVRIEAIQEGRLVSWDIERHHYDAIHRIDFRLPMPMPFLRAMSGQWRVVALAPRRCLLSVFRRWTLLDEVAGIREGVRTPEEAADLVEHFIEQTAAAEMEAIRMHVAGSPALAARFRNRHWLPQAPDAVFRVLAHAAGWAAVLPNCEAVEIGYDDGIYQEFKMRIRTPRGLETFRSIRRCDAQALSIDYFQREPPAVLRRHRGGWRLRSCDGGTEVIDEHEIELDLDNCAYVFGPAGPAAYKQRVQELITANGRATVEACGAWLTVQATVADGYPVAASFPTRAAGAAELRQE